MLKRRNVARPGRAAWTALALVLGAIAPLHAQAARTPEFLVTVPSAHEFSATVEALKAAIEGQDLMVIEEIDPQRMLRMVGVKTGGMRQILFFHPRYMKRVFEVNPNGSIEPPLKIAVMEMPDGRVMVRYVAPEYQFGRYAGLEKIGDELSGVLDAIVSSIKS